jgi:hypothetical protein
MPGLRQVLQNDYYMASLDLPNAAVAVSLPRFTLTPPSALLSAESGEGRAAAPGIVLQNDRIWVCNTRRPGRADRRLGARLAPVIDHGARRERCH